MHLDESIIKNSTDCHVYLPFEWLFIISAEK